MFFEPTAELPHKQIPCYLNLYQLKTILCRIKMCGSLFALPTRLKARVAPTWELSVTKAADGVSAAAHRCFSSSPEKSKQILLRSNTNDSKTHWLHKAHGMRQPCSVPSPRQHCNSSSPSASSTHASALLNKSLFHCHFHTKQSQIMNSSTCILLFSLFFRPH